MCKCLKRLTVALTFILCFTLSGAAAYGAGDEIIDTEVTYQPSEPAGWPDLELELSARGGGYVLDGDAHIEEGIVTYTLREGVEKKFQFVAKQGYRLESLTRNDISVLSSLNEKNELTVIMPAEKQKIEAVFILEQAEPEIPGENTKPDNTKPDNTKPGDVNSDNTNPGKSNAGSENPENVKAGGIWANGIKTGDWQNNLQWANLMILSMLLILWSVLGRRKR